LISLQLKQPSPRHSSFVAVDMKGLEVVWEVSDHTMDRITLPSDYTSHINRPNQLYTTTTYNCGSLVCVV
jgi:hypothetical protein